MSKKLLLSNELNKYNCYVFDTSKVTDSTTVVLRGESNGNIVGTNVGFIVDWGDGTIEKTNSNPTTISHTYATDGVYTVKTNARINSSSGTGDSNTRKMLVEVKNIMKTSYNLAYMFYNCTNLTKVTILSSSNKISNIISAFYFCSSLTEIDGLEKLDISSVTTLYQTFYYCKSLKSLNLAGWQSNNLTTMKDTFNGCSALTELIAPNLVTSATTELSNTFHNCSSLVNLDVSNWDVSSVTTMSSCFYNCSSLVNLNLANWYTPKLNYLSSMFQECTSLTYLDVSNWSFSSITFISGNYSSYQYVLRKCNNLTLENILASSSTKSDWEYFLERRDYDK